MENSINSDLLQLQTLEKEEQNKEIIRLTYRGLSREDIAKEVGLSIAEVHSRISYLRSKGVLPYYSFAEDRDTPAKRRTPTVREQEFLDLYSEGFTSEQIAESMGISMNSVRVYLTRLRQKGLCPRKIKIRVKNEKYVRIRTEIERQVDQFLRENDQFFVNEIFRSRKKTIFVEIDRVEEIVKALGYKKEDVNLLVRLYVERGLYEYAINLLKRYELNNKLSTQEAKMVGEIRHTLRIKLLEDFKGDVPTFFYGSDSIRDYM